MARFLMFPPSWPRQVGQQVSLGLQFEQTRWPAWHWGGWGVKKTQYRKIGSSQQSRKPQYMILGEVIYLKDWGEDIVETDRALE